MKLSFDLLPLKCQFFIIFIYIRQWWNFAIESDQKTFFVRLEWLLTFITSYFILILPIPNDVVSSKTWWINRTIHPIKKEEKKKQSTKPLVAHGWRTWTDSVDSERELRKKKTYKKCFVFGVIVYLIRVATFTSRKAVKPMKIQWKVGTTLSQ